MNGIFLSACLGCLAALLVLRMWDKHGIRAAVGALIALVFLQLVALRAARQI
jgi:hypothetical protein